MILIVGAGTIGLQYADILTAMSVPFTLICRSQNTANKVAECTKYHAVPSEVSSYLANSRNTYTHAIVATAIADLAQVTSTLISVGIKHILVEKPLTFSVEEATKLFLEAKAVSVSVAIAYNRRFLPSVQMLKTLLANDSAIISCRFEFTEWIDKIQWTHKDDKLIENWLLANSSHVIDLAFYLIGQPKMISCIADTPITSAGMLLPASRFAGYGLSDKNVMFSYLSCWDAPGRWRVEVMTANYRYLLEPLEQLSVTVRNSVKTDRVDCSDSSDHGCKPGFYQQVRAFLQNSPELMSIQQLALHLQNCRRMATGCQESDRAAVNE